MKLNGFTDIHHHLVWGMDDGPPTIGESVKMLYAAGRDNITQIIATPHVNPGVEDFDLKKYLNRIGFLNKYSMDNRLGVAVYPGSEIMYTDKAARFLAERRIPSLANSEFALIEFHRDVEYSYIYEASRSLANNGYIPVLAHIERYACLMRNLKHIAELKDQFFVRVQVSCSAFWNATGRQMRRALDKIARNGLMDYVATDAHNTGGRPACMRDCHDYLYDSYGPRFADAMTGINQQEILRAYIVNREKSRRQNTIN